MKIFLTFTLLLSALVQLSVQQDGECRDTKLCPEGCCSSAGHCGYRPDYCGQVDPNQPMCIDVACIRLSLLSTCRLTHLSRKRCQSTCDRKSDCNPGWESNDFSKGDKCPLMSVAASMASVAIPRSFARAMKSRGPRAPSVTLP